MQQATVDTQRSLMKGSTVKATALIGAEWNQNRYAVIRDVGNASGVEDYDSEMYPIESIIASDRPIAGLLKARVSQRGRPISEGYVSRGYSEVPSQDVVYTAGVTAKYKYWTSPRESAATGIPTLRDTMPYVTYAAPMWCNKISIQFDNSISQPSNWAVQLTVDGKTWITVAVNPPIGEYGRCNLWRNADGSWTSSRYQVNPDRIMGLRIVVNAMTRNAVFLSLVELSLRLERDLSEYLIDYSVNNTMSESSQVTPLGVASSNEGSITFSNVDGTFNNNNPNSIYAGTIDKNVLLTGTLIYDNSINGSNTKQAIPQFYMYSTVWAGQGEDTVTVSMVDPSRILQERKPSPQFYESMTVGEIIWRLCDSVGFKNYRYDRLDDDPATLVPYFWCNGEDTVWDIINQLSQSTQTAVYFDEVGFMRIQTREVAYNRRNPVAWTFDGEVVKQLNGRPNEELGKQPDIIDISQNVDYEANVINVKYQNTSISEVKNNIPIMETVWQPEDQDVVLRASALKYPVGKTSTAIGIDPGDARDWPWQGIMQVQGEFIRHTAKQYNFWNGNRRELRWVRSLDEQIALDKRNPFLSYKNYYTGVFNIEKISNRGLWNSDPKEHPLGNYNGYVKRYRTYDNPVLNSAGGFRIDSGASVLRLTNAPTARSNSWYVASRGSEGDAPLSYYGTRIQFPASGYKYGSAGLAVMLGAGESGYYAEIIRTAAMGTSRKYNHELYFYVKKTNGSIVRFGPENGKGVPIQIENLKWYDLELAYRNYGNGTGHQFDISLNGIRHFTVAFGADQGTGQPKSGRFGVYVRGSTVANFEYLYGSTGVVSETDMDGSDFFDRVQGGYQSSQVDRDWLYGYRKLTRIVKKKRVSYQQRYTNAVLDEFGPIVHEVREYDVKFTKTPVIHSRIYFSNGDQVICPEYNGNAFGAKFILANASRNKAIVQGNDTFTFGPDNSIDHVILIYGRTVNQDEPKTYTTSKDTNDINTIKNENAVRRRGPVELDIESPWIQSEAAAKDIAEWISYHWGTSSDELVLQVFGNPLIQLGDLVAINYPQKNYYRNTHKYFVIGVSQSYDGGLETSLTLRRAKV